MRLHARTHHPSDFISVLSPLNLVNLIVAIFLDDLADFALATRAALLLSLSPAQGAILETDRHAPRRSNRAFCRNCGRVRDARSMMPSKIVQIPARVWMSGERMRTRTEKPGRWPQRHGF
jgi:hypothetical protein